jgi:hypothetical protein
MIGELKLESASDIEQMIDGLHHTFGDNDIIVARRQQRNAVGEALVCWTEIVDRLEWRRPSATR